MYPYYRKKVSKHTNAWRLMLALLFSSNRAIALSPLLQAIIKGESPFCMKVTIIINFLHKKNGSIYNVYYASSMLKADNNEYGQDCSDLSKSHWLHHNPVKATDISVKYKWVTCLSHYWCLQASSDFDHMQLEQSAPTPLHPLTCLVTTSQSFSPSFFPPSLSLSSPYPSPPSHPPLTSLGAVTRRQVALLRGH